MRRPPRNVRQQQIMELSRSGKTIDEIASQLGVKPDWVRRLMKAPAVNTKPASVTMEEK